MMGSTADHAYGHTGAAKHRFDHLAVSVTRDQNALFNVVATYDAARRDAQIEDRIPSRRQLVNHLSRGRPAVEDAGITFFENDHATALDAWVARVHRSGNEIGESDVGDEAAPLLHLQDGVLVLLPLDDTQLAVQHPGIDSDVGNWLSETESATPGLAVFAGLGRRGQFHVAVSLLWCAALVNRSQRQAPGQARGCRPSIDPSQLKCHQSQRQISRTRDESALFRVHEHRRNSGTVKGFQHLGLSGSPFMGIPAALSHQFGHRPAGHGACRLHQHLKVVAICKAPLNLACHIGGQGAQRLRLEGGSGRHRKVLSRATLLMFTVSDTGVSTARHARV
jgi:hypothetical protein